MFIAGYADPNDPVPNSLAGFPTNLAGVRDLLYLNEGNDATAHAFREVGVQAGLEAASRATGSAPSFTDYNGDGRPDLYVANDEDPNQLYENVPWPGGAAADPAGLGFRFEERGAAEGVADPFAGMGVAASATSDGGLDLFVTNSRNEPSAAFRGLAGAIARVRRRAPDVRSRRSGAASPAGARPGSTSANTGKPDLVLAAGAIPVTKLSQDAEPVRVLAPVREARDALRRRRGRPRGRWPPAERARPRRGGRRTTTAGWRSRSTRSAASSCSSARRARAATGSTCSCRGSRPAPSSPSSFPTAGGSRARCRPAAATLLRGSARALRARQGDDGGRVTVRYPWGGAELRRQRRRQTGSSRSRPRRP